MNEVDHIFRYPVGRHVDIPVVGFVKYYRNMYHLAENGKILREWNVCFQVVEEDDSVLILFNRKYKKKDMFAVKLFKFNGVWCIKLGGSFWNMMGSCFDRNLYILKDDDSSISISNKEFEDSKLVQTFGNQDTCLLQLSDLLGDSEDAIKDYMAEFSNGICRLIPLLYPGEIKLIMTGNGILLPLDSFYDKIKREVEGDKTYVSIRFNDKDGRIEFIK